MFAQRAGAEDTAPIEAGETAPVEFDVLLGDVEAGEVLYQAVCKACHGPTAKGMASFPKLADKEVEYLAQRLIQYRAGEKVGPNSALMVPVASDLSDQDIADVSAYISESFD